MTRRVGTRPLRERSAQLSDPPADPLFLNAFDWLSRVKGDGGLPDGLVTTAGKPVALLSASPGPAGELRSMNHVRQLLQMTIGMIVVPRQFALGRADSAFDADGALADARSVRAVAGVLESVAYRARALRRV